MTQKNKANKAQEFLKKYQLAGTFNGGFNVDDTLMQNPYEFVPDLQTAQQQQMVQLNQAKSQISYQPVSNVPTFDAVPLIGPAINLGIGIKNIFDSFKERKRQKQYERAYKKDLERRMEESRTSDYYHTPYEFNWNNNAGSYQEGGTQNSLNEFLDYYNQKENQSNITQELFESYYQDKNLDYLNKWKNKQSQGIQSALSGAMGIAQTFIGQRGGQIQRRTQEKIIYGSDGKERVVLRKPNLDYDPSIKIDTSKVNPHHGEEMRDTSNKSKSKDRFREMEQGGEYDPKTDLYSKEFDPNTFLGIVKDEVSIAEQDDKIESQIENWLFEEDDYDYSPINESYFSSTNSFSGNVIDKIGSQESGGNYEAINPYSGAVGKYQFMPSYWAGQIKSYMNLPQSYNREQVMESFKRNPEAQEKFMEYVTSTIYEPEAEKLLPEAQKYGLNKEQVIRMLHYRGIKDTRTRLKTGDFSVSPEEKAKYKNPDVMQYLNK